MIVLTPAMVAVELGCYSRAAGGWVFRLTLSIVKYARSGVTWYSVVAIGECK
jgi:hypothetical protein